MSKVMAAAVLLAAFAAMAAPTLEEQAIALSKELRNPASVNTTLYESEGREASEIKARIFVMLREGRSREEILAALARQYGETIRYSPAVSGGTAALWATPWIVLAFAAGTVFYAVRRRRRPSNLKENKQ